MCVVCISTGVYVNLPKIAFFSTDVYCTTDACMLYADTLHLAYMG